MKLNKFLIYTAALGCLLASAAFAQNAAFSQLTDIIPAGSNAAEPRVEIQDGNLLTLISDKAYASRREAEIDMLLKRSGLIAEGMEVLSTEILKDSRNSYYFVIRYRKHEFQIGRFSSPLFQEWQVAQDKLAEMTKNMDESGLKVLGTNVTTQYGVTLMYTFEISYALNPNLLLENVVSSGYQDRNQAESGAESAANALKQSGIPVMVSIVNEIFSGAGRLYQYQVVYARNTTQDWGVKTYTSPLYNSSAEAQAAMQTMVGSMPNVISSQVQVKYDGVSPRYYYTVTYKAHSAKGK